MVDGHIGSVVASGILEGIGAMVLWLFAAWLLTWGFVSLRHWWKRRGSEGWPQVEAYVESANWDYKGGERESFPIAKIAYSYEVEGERYANIWERAFRTADQATDFVVQMRNRKVVVRYHPGKPEKSIVTQVIGL